MEVATTGTGGRILVGHGEDIVGTAIMFPKGAAGEGQRVGRSGTGDEGEATQWGDRSVVNGVVYVVGEAGWSSKGEWI